MSTASIFMHAVTFHDVFNCFINGKLFRVEGRLFRQTTDAILKNAIPTEIHVDRNVITLYIHIHQGATISCVMEYDFALNIKTRNLVSLPSTLSLIGWTI